eukprot:GFKZ01001851.1.p3 GENE.GFKZ01001851.1~~GFKZ01001851.1.p3  ORF type:complete len:101 (+),score=1.65 GFKZ01001851.1:544-846(+)
MMCKAIQHGDAKGVRTDTPPTPITQLAPGNSAAPRCWIRVTPFWPANIVAHTVSLISHSDTITDILGSRTRRLAPSYDPIATALDIPPHHQLEGLLQAPH